MRSAVVTVVVSGALGMVVAAPAVAAAPPPGGPAPAVVEYRGLSIPVPAGWPVHWLDRDPARCVRFDQHAIYLGVPGEQQDCPPRAVGRTEALLVEPVDVPAGARGALVADRLAGLQVPDEPGQEIRMELPASGVAITGSYGADRPLLQRTLRTARLSSPGPLELSAPRSESALRRGVPAAVQAARPRSWATGYGFDTCAAPSWWAMRAWRPTYGFANIYIGGSSRACAQPNLTRAWVRAVRGMGYRLIPTYVGVQAPCTRFTSRLRPWNASWHGRRSADDAARQARKLGIPRHRPVYYDMEAYDSRKAWCRQAVMAFLHSYTVRLKQRGYVAGVYSSVASTIRDLGWATNMTKPSVIWYAHWDGKAKVHGSPYLPDRWWSPHRRIKQYRGGHREKHGGITLNIDSNIVDSRVY